jgi:hypothetical protein
MPLLPLLVLRKVWVARKPAHAIVSAGFDTGSLLRDRLLALLSCCERVPQHVAGTSLMAALRRD